MKRVITLPDIEAVKNFVHAAGEMDTIVLVSKAGYTYTIDGASLLGMMTLMGAKILVETAHVSEKLKSLIENYAVVC